MRIRGGGSQAQAEARALLGYNAARAPEGGPAEAGGLTASSVPLLDSTLTIRHAESFGYK